MRPGQQLFDVVDVDHRPGVTDSATRPNQIFAVGGLPLAVLSGPRARQVVDRVEAKLWTPSGLRSLAQDEPGFVPHYLGGPKERDSAYHQGTVWPWLAGAFIEAWVRVRGNTPEAKQEARERYFESIRALMTTAGLNHLPEITDAVEPYSSQRMPVPGMVSRGTFALRSIVNAVIAVIADNGVNRSLSAVPTLRAISCVVWKLSTCFF